MAAFRRDGAPPVEEEIEDGKVEGEGEGEDNTDVGTNAEGYTESEGEKNLS